MTSWSEIVLVTPDLAKEWLKLLHPSQRLVDVETVNAYAELMGAGEWVFTNKKISFDTHRRLINGQHRLSACVESGASFPVIVSYNEETRINDSF